MYIYIYIHILIWVYIRADCTYTFLVLLLHHYAMFVRLRAPVATTLENNFREFPHHYRKEQATALKSDASTFCGLAHCIFFRCCWDPLFAAVVFVGLPPLWSHSCRVGVHNMMSVFLLQCFSIGLPIFYAAHCTLSNITMYSHAFYVV